MLIPPAGRRYEVLDLDELAGAVELGGLDVDAALTVLRNTQRFIDRHLRDAEAGPDDPWPDFPPRSLEVLAALDVPGPS